MINRYRQIVGLYLRHPAFRLLAVTLIICEIGDVILFHRQSYSLVEEFWDLVVVLNVWLACTAGVIIKEQFANHRAALLPRYRVPHIMVAGVLFFFFSFFLLGWLASYYPELLVSPAAVEAIFLYSTLVALAIVIVGYVSVNTVLFLAYFVLLFFSWKAFSLITIVAQDVVWNFSMIAGILVLGVIFIWRLLVLKEERWEYPFLLSWPQKSFSKNQLPFGEKFHQGIDRFSRLWGFAPRRVVFPTYPRRKYLLARAVHWEYIEQDEFQKLFIGSLILSPGYLYLVKNTPLLADFCSRAYSNFLLLAIAPVLISLLSNYRKMPYWGYDLLKPVRRPRYLRERGAALFGQLILHWFIFCLYMVILPNAVFNPEALLSPKIWAYLGFTGCFAFLVLAWLSYLSSCRDERVVVGHGVLAALLAVIYFYLTNFFPVELITLNSGFCLLAGGLFLKIAYRQWCDAEFF